MIVVTSPRDERTRVSLRLPPELAEQIERYAIENRLSKTDAYVRFLRLGLEAQEAHAGEEALREISEKLDSVLERLGAEGSKAVRGDKASVVSAVREIASRYPAIKKAWLFGSFARGTFGDSSDVDLRIELDRTKAFSLRELSHFGKEIERLIGRDVDVVSAARIKNEQLRDAIELDKELIYERKEQ